MSQALIINQDSTAQAVDHAHVEFPNEAGQGQNFPNDSGVFVNRFQQARTLILSIRDKFADDWFMPGECKRALATVDHYAAHPDERDADLIVKLALAGVIASATRTRLPAWAIAALCDKPQQSELTSV